MLDMTVLAEELAAIIKEQVTAEIAPLTDRIAALEDAMKQEKSLAYKGVYAAGEVYDVGSLVTCGGSLWHCDRLTKAKPGEAADCWTLAVKKGRDGKDATRATA